MDIRFPKHNDDVNFNHEYFAAVANPQYKANRFPKNLYLCQINIKSSTMNKKVTNWQIVLMMAVMVVFSLGLGWLLNGTWTKGLSVLIGAVTLPFVLAIANAIATDEACPNGPIKKMTPATRKRIRNLSIIGVCCLLAIIALDICLTA